MFVKYNQKSNIDGREYKSFGISFKLFISNNDEQK